MERPGSRRPGRRAGLSWGLAIALGLLVGVPPAPAGGALSANTLNVFAADSLAEAFNALGKVFEARSPEIHVKFTFAPPQQLAQQIEQGVYADVFASTESRWMQEVQSRGLIQGPPQEFARNRLVIITPRDNPGKIAQLRDLARPGVKLVIGAATTPAGHDIREALGKLSRAPGFGGDFDRRVLQNVTSEEDTARAVITKVQRGEADAGAVYRSDVTTMISDQLGVMEIPDQYNVIASYPIATVKGGPPELCREFIALVLSTLGQQILVGYHFIPAGPR